MEERGYDVSRFEGEIRQDLLCSFCFNVPEDARLCQNHDHLFCFAHISRHLVDHTTCPSCREHLTPETLRRPTGFIRNYLDDLMINCEYHDRGCPEHVRLEFLQNHVDQCGFAPVTCANEGCGMEINTRDLERHERDLCHFRIVRYRNIEAAQEEIMERQSVIMQGLSEVMASQDEIRNIRDAMQRSEDEIKANQDEIKVNQDEIKENQDEMKANQDEIKANQDEIKENQDEMKARQERVERRQGRMNRGLEKVKEDVSGIKRKQDEIDDTLKNVKVRLKKLGLFTCRAFSRDVTTTTFMSHFIVS